MIVRLPVTQAHIDKAVSRINEGYTYVCNCPGAIAVGELLDVLPGYIRVTPFTIVVEDRHYGAPGPSLRDAILIFDDGGDFPPGEYYFITSD